MLPTDPRFLQMTREQIIREFWMIYYFETRKRNPNAGVETEFDGSEAFDQAMRDAGMEYNDATGGWEEVEEE